MRKPLKTLWASKKEGVGMASEHDGGGRDHRKGITATERILYAVVTTVVTAGVIGFGAKTIENEVKLSSLATQVESLKRKDESLETHLQLHYKDLEMMIFERTRDRYTQSDGEKLRSVVISVRDDVMEIRETLGKLGTTTERNEKDIWAIGTKLEQAASESSDDFADNYKRMSELNAKIAKMEGARKLEALVNQLLERVAKLEQAIQPPK